MSKNLEADPEDRCLEVAGMRPQRPRCGLDHGCRFEMAGARSDVTRGIARAVENSNGL